MGGLNLGKIFGVRIAADWSLFVALWLVAVSLALGSFPVWHPEWGGGMRWGIACIAAVLLFASVLVHELSHALVARRYGLEVRSIHLFVFGGVANIEREPETPRAELMMAIVGPLTSIGLGLLFLALGGWLARLGGDPERLMRDLGPAATLLFWLGPLNFFLGLFNLLPGFPLDGGRVLRALLWQATGDLQAATRWASLSGQAIGFVLVFGGLAMIFGARLPWLGSGVVSGLWISVIGWFLASAAAMSYRQLVIMHLVEGVPVRRLMRRDVAVVPPDLPVARLVDDYLMRSDQRAFPVLTGERLAGIVCLEDVRVVDRDVWNEIEVGTIMTPLAALETIRADDDLTVAMRAFSRKDVEQLPVVDGDHLVGVLRRRDILKWLELQAPRSERPIQPRPA
ncbi:Zn-dependent protease (includes SpoIVFB) [Nannocystis exedens]|uniref:Zinc metalloprotease n=1 Tax=Nannocystis exedens TaxID=54 RepID=A0A1I1YDD6_9BACT|nr:site-2 protease family protein [Nannocystis exedens]PCC71903.1 peptidase M50 [Nannocystis exedens]SFE16103.1 Zn-dependent protease (includes SpoIVFB) [Nannocystis exedens]